MTPPGDGGPGPADTLDADLDADLDVGPEAGDDGNVGNDGNDGPGATGGAVELAVTVLDIRGRPVQGARLTTGASTASTGVDGRARIVMVSGSAQSCTWAVTGSPNR